MNIWVFIYRFSWISLVVLVVIATVCMFWPRYQQYVEYQRRETELQQKIRLETERLKILKRNQERFRSDPRFIERIAHEMGLARSDETIFKFKEERLQED